MNKEPEHLYKILSMEHWEASQSLPFLQLSKDDTKFIHFSTRDQLDRIINKFWWDEPEFVILKINVSLLPGRLIYETNPGRANRYYHLYDGSIPFKAVIACELRSNPSA